MNAKRTPEPWSVQHDQDLPNRLPVDSIYDADGEIVAEIVDDGACASRIVSCVNAMKGIADPEAALQAAREALREFANDNPACRCDLCRPCSARRAIALLSPK